MPIDKADALAQVANAAHARKLAESEEQIATADLRKWCRKAHEAGAQVTEIASVAGLSRQGVYDLLALD